MSKYFDNKGDDIIFTGTYMEIYIPQRFFDRKLSVNMGQYIETFGLLAYAVFDDKNRVNAQEIFNLPTKINIFPNEIEWDNRTINVKGSKIPLTDKYCVCKFYHGNKVMPATIVQSSDNVELFLDLLLKGEIAHPVPYDKVLSTWLSNLHLNNISFNIPIATMGVLVRELYRSKNDIDIKYSKVMGKNPSADPLGYKTLNTRQICARTSVFTALASEDPDVMITSSLNMTASGRKQNISPVEKVIKM